MGFCMKKIFLGAVMFVVSADVMAMKTGKSQENLDDRNWMPCVFRECRNYADEKSSLGKIRFGYKGDVHEFSVAEIKNREGHQDSLIIFSKKHVLLSDKDLCTFAEKAKFSVDNNTQAVCLNTEKNKKYMNWNLPYKQVEDTFVARLNKNLEKSRLHVAFEPGPQKLANKQAAIDPQARLQLNWLGKVVVFVQHGDESQTFTLPEQALNLLQTRLELSDDGIEMRVEKPQQFHAGSYSDTPAIAEKFFIKKENASVIKYRYIYIRNLFSYGAASLIAVLALAYAYCHSK